MASNFPPQTVQSNECKSLNRDHRTRARHIGPHVVHHNREPLKQGIDGLIGEMSEVLVLSPVSRIHLSLNLGVSNMSFLQHRSDSTSQALCVHPIKLRLTQSTKQVVDCLVVGVEHVRRSWSKEVHRLDITCVYRDIPKDLTLSAEERRHPLTPHLLVLPIEVWRIQTPFLVRHLWILD
jgi:hypothetical protein